MTRIKAVSFTTRAEFDAALERIAKQEAQLRLLVAARDKAVQAVQAEHEPKIAATNSVIEMLTLQCEKYAEDNRAALLPTDRKSDETTFATFGFRLGNPALKLLNSKWTWDKVLVAIKASALFKQYVRIVAEEVDKDGIKGNKDLKDADLATVGLRIEQPEKFFIDPKADGAGKVEVPS